MRPSINLLKNKKNLFSIISLYFSSYIWYYAIYQLIFRAVTNNLNIGLNWAYLGNGIFFLSTVVFYIIGGTIGNKFERRKFLSAWIVLSIISTAVAFFIWNLYAYLFYTLIPGAIFGLGLPTCLAFCSESANIEERGRIFGITNGVTYILLPIIIAVSLSLNLDLIKLITICILIRSFGSFTIFSKSLNFNTSKITEQQNPLNKWSSIIINKNFISYFLPWIIFSISTLIFSEIMFFKIGQVPLTLFAHSQQITVLLQYFFSGISAYISGVVSDQIGRKNLIILGIICLGASFAFLSLSTSLAIFLIIGATSGASIGILNVNYLSVLGDSATRENQEKYFALGMGVPTFVIGISFVFNNFFHNLNNFLVSSLLSMTLFLSIFPLLYAKETLPEDLIEHRKYRDYFEQVLKIIREQRTSE